MKACFALYFWCRASGDRRLQRRERGHHGTKETALHGAAQRDEGHLNLRRLRLEPELNLPFHSLQLVHSSFLRASFHGVVRNQRSRHSFWSG